MNHRKIRSFPILLLSSLLLTSCMGIQATETADDTVRKEETVAITSETSCGTYIFRTLSEMKKSVPSEAAAIVYLQGYLHADDGGGGTFYWDADSESKSDDGTVIVPNGLENKTGRYIRDYEPQSVNVLWFGADPTGKTDSADAIQKAIDAIPAGGGDIIIPGGKYLLEKPIVIGDGDGTKASTRNGIRIIGCGAQFGHMTAGETTLQCSKQVDTVLTINGPITGCSLIGFKINGNNLCKTVLTMNAVSDSRFELLQVICFNEIGIKILAGTGEAGCSSGNIFTQIGAVTNCNNAEMVRIDGDPTTGAIVRDSVFTCCRFDTAQQDNCTALHIRFAEKLTFKRCHFNVYKFDTATGLLLDAMGCGGYPKQCSYYDCSITRLKVSESGSDKIGWNFLLGNGSADNELYEENPHIFGITDIGSIVRYDG